MVDAGTGITGRLKTLVVHPSFPWLLVAVGVALRLVHYLHDTSLSVDESHLSLNVLGRSAAELVEPLEGNQGAPLFFLLLLKGVIGVFGESELALRLIALVCGVASLFLFKSLAARYLDPPAATIALGLFAVAGNLIFYSAQVKQYAGDVMFAILLYLMADVVRKTNASWGPVLLYGLLGALALGFSHPAVFVLGGLALSFATFHFVGPGRQRSFRVMAAFAIWGATFLLLYWLNLRKLASNEWLLSFWADEFMPLPPTSMSDIRWYVTAFFQMFSKMLGFSLQGICGLTVLIGAGSLLRSHRERLAGLVLPIFLALGASALHEYPFCCRLILFAAPALLLLMARGAMRIVSATKGRTAIGVTLIVLMFLHPVMWAGYYVVHPRYENEVKPELRYLDENRRPEDVVYVYYGAKPAFTYYARRYGWNVDECCVIGVRSREDWDAYDRDLKRFRGEARVWIVFTHIFDWGSVDERVLFLQYLDDIGTRLDGFETQGAAIYLYDLRRPTGQRP